MFSSSLSIPNSLCRQRRCLPSATIWASCGRPVLVRALVFLLQHRVQHSHCFVDFSITVFAVWYWASDCLRYSTTVPVPCYCFCSWSWSDAFSQSSARFSDLGTSVVLTFDMDTDYGATAGLGGSFQCTLLLTYAGSSDLDICSWSSGSSIVWISPSVVPSSNVSLDV